MSNRAEKRNESGPEAFYGRVAEGYDEMVDVDRRVAAAERFVGDVVDRFLDSPPRIGVDLGCGTGAYALALARYGMDTTGIDVSGKMLAIARQHAIRRAQQIAFVQAPLQDLPDTLPWGHADVVLCLGNTLPHLTDPAILENALAELKRLLAPGGVCVVQTLNYDRILERRERIVSIDRHRNREFIRFYDFLDHGLIRFNILGITWERDDARHGPIDSVMLRGYTHDQLRDMAASVGLTTHLTAGNLALEPYDRDESPTILLVLGRP